MPIVGSADIAQKPEVERLLAAARVAISQVPYCWVVTSAQDGGAHARVVKAFPNENGEPWWTRWFLTRRLARKTAEIRNAGRVTLAFQHHSGDAYVSLAGPAELIETHSAVKSRLEQVDDPAGALTGQLIAVRVDADQIEIHIRGVTAEPWGHGRTFARTQPRWRLGTSAALKAAPIFVAAGSVDDDFIQPFGDCRLPSCVAVSLNHFSEMQQHLFHLAAD